MATQSHRSNGPRGPYDSGTAGIQSTRVDCLGPRLRIRCRAVLLDPPECWGMGTRAYMTSSGTNNVRAGGSWIGILLLHLRRVAADRRPGAGGGLRCRFRRRARWLRHTLLLRRRSRSTVTCTIRNFPASNPLTTNISFFGNNRHVLAGHLRQRRVHGQHVVQPAIRRATSSGSPTARRARSSRAARTS